MKRKKISLEREEKLQKDKKKKRQNKNKGKLGDLNPPIAMTILNIRS
jgi:hypothetical protein